MGDGSVKNFDDGANADGYLNPGFPIGVATALTDASGVGYSDDEIELQPSECFSGIFLDETSFKGQFEEN
jgi:hypothetical protein